MYSEYIYQNISNTTITSLPWMISLSIISWIEHFYTVLVKK